MALSLDSALRKKIKTRVLHLQKNSILKRLGISLSLGFRLWRGKNKYVVHLGLEALIARCFFPLRGRAVFINHGIYRFPDKFSLFRNIVVLLEQIGNIVNDIFYVDAYQMGACNSKNFFQNRADVEHLSFQSRLISSESTFGFVGSLYGQKNCGVLKEAINKFSSNKFLHLNLRSESRYFSSPNYEYLKATERERFFNEIDVLLIPSIYESYCLIAYEAAFSGVYVIHSGIDGLSSFPYPSSVVSQNTADSWIYSITEVLEKNFYTEKIYSDDICAMDRNVENVIKFIK